MDARAMERPERWARIWGWTTVVGLEFGLVGPFGSYPASPVNRLAFWVGLFWAGALLLWPGLQAARRLGARLGFPVWFALSLATLGLVVPLSLVAALGCWLLWPVHASGIRPLEWYGSTLLVAGPAAALIAWAEGRQAGAAAPRPAAPARTVPDLADATDTTDALPSPLLATALCLQMEDHHVRVHLPTHSRLHLATLNQAIAAMEEGRGRQVHRSWWVARAAVKGWEEEGRTLFLRLANDLRVPVARARVAALRADGWLG
jgi:hypothetical protein